MKKNAMAIVAGIALISIILAGFTFVPQELRSKIDSDKVKSVKTEITFPAGRLYISPDAKSICEGLYKYRKEFWKPEINYHEDSGTGYLDIEVEDSRDKRNYDDSDQNEWAIAFNRNIENEMSIHMIAGESNIDLQGCSLKRFDFEMIAGKSYINLKNTSVPFLDFKAVAGEAEIDLSGKWDNDLDAEIKGGVGELTIILPRGIGIKMNITGGLGDVDAPGFRRDNRIYTNKLYGETKSSLYIEITGGIGNVDIRIED